MLFARACARERRPSIISFKPLPPRAPYPPEPQLMGKASTAVQFSMFTGALLQQTVGWPGPEAVAALCWITAGTTGVRERDAGRGTRREGRGERDEWLRCRIPPPF